MFSNEAFRELSAYLLERFTAAPREAFKRHIFLDTYTHARWFFEPFNKWGEGVMVRGKGKARPAVRSKSSYSTEFVEISLDGVGIEEIRGHFPDSDDIYNGVARLLENGYRVGLSYNPQNDAVIASLTCRDEESANSGKTLTGFAKVWPEALMVVLYKHYVIAREEWTGEDGSAARPVFG